MRGDNEILENLVREAQRELCVSPESAQAYEKEKETLLQIVNDRLTKHPDLARFLGASSLQVMYDNHRNHVNFMINVLKLNEFAMLARMVPWVYRVYHRHGFSYDYFLEELRAWQNAVLARLNEKHAKEINRVYDWLLDHHEVMVALSSGTFIFTAPVMPEWRKQKDRFLSFLLDGNFESCLSLSEQIVREQKDVKEFYLQVVQPSLYDIGTLWEEGKISVAEEHLATAIVGRVMASLYTRIPRRVRGKKKIVLTAAPNEFHEVGCRMVADFLEAEGWDVYYLGANTPQVELFRLLKKVKPKVLGISVTMPFNLVQVEEIVMRLQREEDFQEMKIMVGGIAFNLFSDLWRKLGVHGWAKDAETAVALVREWVG